MFLAVLRPPPTNRPPSGSLPSHASSEFDRRQLIGHPVLHRHPTHPVTEAEGLSLSSSMPGHSFCLPFSTIKCLHKRVMIQVAVHAQWCAVLPFLLHALPQAQRPSNSFHPISYHFLFIVYTSTSFRPISCRRLFTLHTCFRIWIGMKFVHSRIVLFLCSCSIAVTFKVPPN
jgi:hypothetical protein